jgi:hypothetical protein
MSLIFSVNASFDHTRVLVKNYSGTSGGGRQTSARVAHQIARLLVEF